jgi:cytochrome c-type biogenesis protein CcmH
MKPLLSLLLLLLLVAPALAVAPDEMLADPGLEARARSISSELRCLVCQNQSIDDSDADLARELRLIVREQLVQGASDQQVRDFLVARYGEFVLLRPVFAWHTILLWITAPALLLVGLGVLIWGAMRRRKSEPTEPGLTDAEKTALESLSGERQT